MKIYITEINESWVVDKIRKEFIKNYENYCTQDIKTADIVWIIAPWTISRTFLAKIRNKKVICSIYHLDEFKKNSIDLKNFYKIDKYVDVYHTISRKSLNQLERFTEKPIFQIPFWVNTDEFYKINKKEELRSKYDFNSNCYLVGSFQRDSEGGNTSLPKLIKGPDIFLEIIKKMNSEIKNLNVILAGKRRNYLLDNLSKAGIKYRYFEMISTQELNELYNILDLYIVSSRLEGGPQAITECATIEVPIVSTNVGVAPQILNSSSIYNYEDLSTFQFASPDVKYAKKMVKEYETPFGFTRFLEMFTDLNEN